MTQLDFKHERVSKEKAQYLTKKYGPPPKTRKSAIVSSPSSEEYCPSACRQCVTDGGVRYCQLSDGTWVVIG